MTNITTYTFNSPSQVVFGKDSAMELPQIFDGLGSKPMVITDSMIFTQQFFIKIIELIRKKKPVQVFSDIDGEPTSEMVINASDSFMRNGCDCILGIGGGSALDTAKAVAIYCSGNKKLEEIEGYEKAGERKIPVVLAPTTAGTGSEATRFSVITDTVRDRKMLISAKSLIPDIALIDPNLTVSCPKRVTAFTGIDALTHAIEAYISVKNNAYTDVFCERAIELTMRNLKQAYFHPDDLQARSNMSMAAFYAGLAISNSSVGLVHAMARPIGALFHLPHGITIAVLLPTVLEYTAPAVPEKIRKIARLINIDNPDVNTIQKVASAIGQFCNDISIPRLGTLIKNDIDFYQKSLKKMAQDAIDSGSVANNPKPATNEQIEQLYLQII